MNLAAKLIYMNKLFLIKLAIINLTLVGSAWAAEEEMSYDEIVANFNTSSRTSASEVRDPFDDVRIQAGLGLASSFIQVKPENAGRASGVLNGVEAHFAIDLFSNNWQAEGAVRSFQTERINPNLYVGLKEFDLAVYYTHFMTSGWSSQFGAGLAARYMHVRDLNETTNQTDYTTPASIFSARLLKAIGRQVHVGADLSYRGALIEETVDKSSLNAGLRMNLIF